MRRCGAKRTKAPVFDPVIRRFESCRPCDTGFSPTHGNGQRAAEHDMNNEDGNLLIFSGNANRQLALAVCRELGVRPGKALVSTFSDGEVQVELEENVRRQDVFVVPPTSAPTVEHSMELLVLDRQSGV